MRFRLVFCTLLLPVCVGFGCTGGGPAGETRPSVQRAIESTPSTTPVPVAFVPGVPDFDALVGATAHYGYQDGTAYRIEVPDVWNGGLVLWAHGFQGWGAELTPASPPAALREAFVREGYAWAASSFSQNGWVPGVGAYDTLALKRDFSLLVGSPNDTLIVGQSMGGNVVVVSMEQFPKEYVGGLSLCGAVAGVEWIDYLWAWALAGQFLAGVAPPQDAGGVVTGESFERDVLPALRSAEGLSPRGVAFASVIRNLTGGPRPFFDEGFANAFEFNFGLAIGDPARVTEMSRAATTQGIEYRIDPGLGFGDDAINRGVRRLIGDDSLRDPVTHPDTAPTSGHLFAPLLTLHETGDLTVPVSMEQSYRKTVDAAGAGQLLVQRLIRSGGHCAFSDIELLRAWEDLRDWVTNGIRPGGDEVLGDLTDAGRTFTDPLRTGDPAR